MTDDTPKTTDAICDTGAPLTTLNGKFSAYCRVCGNAVYRFWISDEDHGAIGPRPNGSFGIKLDA